MSPSSGSSTLKLAVGGGLLVVIALAFVFWKGEPGASEGPEGERKKRWSGRSFADQTDVEARPGASATTPGWDTERVWSGEDDWEPFVAADPSSDYVYQMTTRFTPRVSAVVLRRSPDDGATWEPDQLVAPASPWQADPQVQVAHDGTVYVVWLDGPDWSTKLVKSLDHGRTWTAPVEVAPTLPWTDHAWLVVSPNGEDVYVGLNQGESYLVASHDGGETFEAPIKTSHDSRPSWLHTGAGIGPDGDVYFAAVDYPPAYRGRTDVYAIRSHDDGASWATTLLDTSETAPDCDWAPGCDYGFLSSSTGLAVDGDGGIMVAYNAGTAPYEPQPIWVRTSADGVTWTPRVPISPPDGGADNAFPAVAAGPTPGDFRVVWQANREDDARAWNTYYRRTTDGGATWGPVVRLSDRAHGAPYKRRAGYAFPYGDYLGLSVDRDGTNHVIWGESISYTGPGGSWYTRGHQPPHPAGLAGSDGSSEPSRHLEATASANGTANGTASGPSAIGLLGSAPNPFTNTTTVAYALPHPGRVRLAVYDLMGREVAVLVDETRGAGRHEAVLDGSGLPAGAYLVRLEAGGSVFPQRVTLVR